MDRRNHLVQWGVDFLIYDGRYRLYRRHPRMRPERPVWGGQSHIRIQEGIRGVFLILSNRTVRLVEEMVVTLLWRISSTSGTEIVVAIGRLE